MEHLHQAVERRHALPQAEGRHRAADPRRPEEAPWATPQPEESAGRGHGKPSVLHPDPQRRRQTVEHMHQAVERRHTLPQAKGRHRAAN